MRAALLICELQEVPHVPSKNALSLGTLGKHSFPCMFVFGYHGIIGGLLNFQHTGLVPCKKKIRGME